MFLSLFVKMDNRKVWGNPCFRGLEFARGDLRYCAPPRQAASITTCGGVSMYVVVQSPWWIQQFWLLSFLSNEFRILHVFKTLFIHFLIQAAATLLSFEYWIQASCCNSRVRACSTSQTRCPSSTPCHVQTGFFFLQSHPTLVCFALLLVFPNDLLFVLRNCDPE